MSSVPANSEPYFDMATVKESLGEEGNTTAENQIQHWGDQSDRDIDSELQYLFSSFPLTEAIVIADGHDANVFRQIKQLSNERTEAKFWLHTNSDNAMMQQSDENLKRFRERLTEIPFTTEN